MFPPQFENHFHFRTKNLKNQHKNLHKKQAVNAAYFYFSLLFLSFRLISNKNLD
jgi:hypothetical protein